MYTYIYICIHIYIYILSPLPNAPAPAASFCTGSWNHISRVFTRGGQGSPSNPRVNPLTLEPLPPHPAVSTLAFTHRSSTP